MGEKGEEREFCGGVCVLSPSTWEGKMWKATERYTIRIHGAKLYIYLYLYIKKELNVKT